MRCRDTPPQYRASPPGYRNTPPGWRSIPPGWRSNPPGYCRSLPRVMQKPLSSVFVLKTAMLVQKTGMLVRFPCHSVSSEAKKTKICHGIHTELFGRSTDGTEGFYKTSFSPHLQQENNLSRRFPRAFQYYQPYLPDLCTGEALFGRSTGDVNEVIILICARIFSTEVVLFQSMMYK